MNKLFYGVMIAVVAAVCIGAVKVAKINVQERPEDSDVRLKMRSLWEDHNVWTRNYIISELANLEDVQAVTDRLLQNQVDIGKAVGQLYGSGVGNTIAGLLKEHITVASQVVKAAKSNNKNGLNVAKAQWFANADKIAFVLSNANKNLPEQTLKDMLYKHLEYVTQEVVSRLNKDWKADIKAYDENRKHMQHLADLLSSGGRKSPSE